ncbi:hypothetical protein MRX96_015996 [Rhipicephalus microplus]
MFKEKKVLKCHAPPFFFYATKWRATKPVRKLTPFRTADVLFVSLLRCEQAANAWYASRSLKFSPRCQNHLFNDEVRGVHRSEDMQNDESCTLLDPIETSGLSHCCCGSWCPCRGSPCSFSRCALQPSIPFAQLSLGESGPTLA